MRHVRRFISQLICITLSFSLVSSALSSAVLSNRPIGVVLSGNQLVQISAQNLNNTLTTSAPLPGVITSIGASQGLAVGIGANNNPINAAGNPSPNLALPTNGLFTIRPNSNQRYLIETNPRFANYQNFISSDYLLSRLGLDPQQTQKRLGDAFYKNKLIRDQITELTGRRFLANIAPETQAQFQALMDNALTVAQEFKLEVGIALTAEQVKQLTSDIVWLVEQEVALPSPSGRGVGGEQLCSMSSSF